MVTFTGYGQPQIDLKYCDFLFFKIDIPKLYIVRDLLLSGTHKTQSINT